MRAPLSVLLVASVACAACGCAGPPSSKVVTHVAVAVGDAGLVPLVRSVATASDSTPPVPSIVGLWSFVATPDFIVARYKLACARAKSGDQAGARTELEAVFTADFVGMRAQAEKDANLADFWKSEPGMQGTTRFSDRAQRSADRAPRRRSSGATALPRRRVRVLRATANAAVLLLSS